MRKSLWAAVGTSLAMVLVAGTAFAASSIMTGTLGSASLQGSVSGINPSLSSPYASASASTSVSVGYLQVCALYSTNGTWTCNVNPSGTKVSSGSASQTSKNWSCSASDVAQGYANYSDSIYGSGTISGNVTNFC